MDSQHGYVEENCFTKPNTVSTVLGGERRLERPRCKQKGSVGQGKHKESGPRREREAVSTTLLLSYAT